MPVEGDIKRTKSYYTSIWAICPNCGEGRWVEYYDWRKQPKVCRSCASRLQGVERRRQGKVAGTKNPNWKGGIRYSRGYIRVWLWPDDPYYAMTTNSYVPEHRLVIARHLGRVLKSSEIVHHLNGIRKDNRIKNLALVNLNNHERNTLTKLLQKRIRELEARLATKGTN